MIDWHCHILPGLDDGAETLGEALEMARLLAAVGYRRVHCTPHCMLGRFDNRPSQVRRATTRLQQELQRAGIPLSLSPGMEYYLDEYFPVLLEQPQTLGDSRLLLVEIPSRASAELVRDNLSRILGKGYLPLLAHPERSPLLGRRSDAPPGWFGRVLGRWPIGGAAATTAGETLLQELRQVACLFQGNLPSFSGRYGRAVQHLAATHLEDGLYRCFGSDGHGAASLEADLLPALQMLSGQRQAAALLRAAAGTVAAVASPGPAPVQEAR